MPLGLTDKELLVRLLGGRAADAVLAEGRSLHDVLMACDRGIHYGGWSVPEDAWRTLEVAFEVGRRGMTLPAEKVESWREAEDVWSHFRGRIGGLDYETFFAVGLDVRLRRVCEVALAGGLDRAVIDPRDVFVPLLKAGAASALLVHNHPSDNPEPSADDRRLTARLAMAGQLVGVQVVDHVIVTATGYHSFAAEGPLL